MTAPPKILPSTPATATDPTNPEEFTVGRVEAMEEEAKNKVLTYSYPHVGTHIQISTLRYTHTDHTNIQIPTYRSYPHTDTHIQVLTYRCPYTDHTHIQIIPTSRYQHTDIHIQIIPTYRYPHTDGVTLIVLLRIYNWVYNWIIWKKNFYGNDMGWV